MTNYRGIFYRSYFSTQASRFTSPADSATEKKHYEREILTLIPKEKTLSVLDVGQNGPEKQRSRFVLGLASGCEVGLKAGE